MTRDDRDGRDFWWAVGIVVGTVLGYALLAWTLRGLYRG